MDLTLLWFLLLGVLLAGYAVLDGFDLGVGILHLGARGNEERRVLINSIGPVWDGNEVWLVTFGGALFAAFPEAYATVFSSFYLAFMLLLFALILRAVSLEFRGKSESAAWRGFWDAGFSAGSLLAALLFGVAAGNAVLGLPVGADREFAGTFLGLLSPYALLTGSFSVCLLALHGALYLQLKTEGELQARARLWSLRAFAAAAVLYLAVTGVTLARLPRALENFARWPWLWSLAAAEVLALAAVPLALRRGRPGLAFLSSCAALAALVGLLGASLYPNLVVSSLDPAWSLTLGSAASSAKTLRIMTLIAALGLPLVLGYTAYIHWVFRGKVKLDSGSY